MNALRIMFFFISTVILVTKADAGRERRSIFKGFRIRRRRIGRFGRRFFRNTNAFECYKCSYPEDQGCTLLAPDTSSLQTVVCSTACFKLPMTDAGRERRSIFKGFRFRSRRIGRRTFRNTNVSYKRTDCLAGAHIARNQAHSPHLHIVTAGSNTGLKNKFGKAQGGWNEFGDLFKGGKTQGDLFKGGKTQGDLFKGGKTQGGAKRGCTDNSTNQQDALTCSLDLCNNAPSLIHRTPTIVLVLMMTTFVVKQFVI